MDLPSALKDVDDMIAMFVAREQDHIRWLKELEGAIGEGRHFTLARDPTECAFGKWYYSYKSDGIGFASVLYRFETPHRRIHSIADVALKYVEQGEDAKAREIILPTQRGDLHTMVNLFEEARTAYRESQKELAVVLTDGRKHVSLTVDSVASVELLAEETMKNATAVMGSVKCDLIKKVARRTNAEGVVFLLDVRRLSQALLRPCAARGDTRHHRCGTLMGIAPASPHHSRSHPIRTIFPYMIWGNKRPSLIAP